MTTRRPALAPLELVLALPMLVLAAAFLHAIAKVGIAKAGASAQARRDAWARPVANGRPEQGKLPGAPGAFTVLTEKQTLSGLADKAVTRNADANPVSKTAIQAKGRLVVLLDPLDHKSAPYGLRKQFVPDPRALRLLTGLVNDAGNLAGQLGELKGLGDQLGGLKGDAMDKLPDIQDKLGELGNHTDEIREKRAQIVKDIADLQKSKDPDKKEKIEAKKKDLEDIDKSLKSIEDAKKTTGKLNDIE